MSLKLVISGWTAAGKSTHAKLLARDLNLPYLSATEVLARLVADRTSTPLEKRWQPRLDQARQDDQSIDDDLDAYLIDMFERDSGAVFDACLLPWVAPAVAAIRIWLESDFPSRLRKCYVSHLDEGIGWDEARSRVQGKDTFTQSRLSRTNGCSYDPSTAAFDLIANNESLIPFATRDTADAGIASFHPVLLQAVRYLTGTRSEAPTSPWISFPRIGR